jgi:prepilin-type N-terminal cleavage/methylation domain-containing protein
VAPQTASLPRAQAGVTLVELAVAVAIAALVGAAIYKIYPAFRTQALNQQRIAKGQSSLLPVQRALEKHLHDAGYRIPLKGIRRTPSGGVDTLAAVTLAPNGARPDGLVLRGNFSQVFTQARAPFPVGAAALLLRLGGADAFQPGDTLYLSDGEGGEYLAVRSVDKANSTLSTSPRLRDYPVGSGVAKVGTVEIRPQDSTLLLVRDGVPRRLAGDLADLRFYCVGMDGSLDSLPPFSLETTRSIRYRVKTRIARVGGRPSTHREAEGLVHMRNLH